MDHDALIRKLGAAIVSDFPLIHHNAFNKRDLSLVGETSLGTPVHLNRALLEGDFIIGVGSISLSIEAGYGGGAKIVIPGEAGAKTVYKTHRRVADHPNQLGRIEGDPIRREIEESLSHGCAGANFLPGHHRDPARNSDQDRADSFLHARIGDGGSGPPPRPRARVAVFP